MLPPSSQPVASTSAQSSHSQAFIDAQASYNDHRLNAGPERTSTNQGFTNPNLRAEMMSLALGTRGPAAQPRGLSNFQANRNRTKELRELQYTSHSAAHSIRMVTLELVKLTYLQSTKPKPPLPPKADGFRPLKKPFPGTTLLGDACLTLIVNYWQDYWLSLGSLTWDFPNDFRLAWADGSLLGHKYLQPIDGQDGWTLNQVCLEGGSDGNRDVYIKSSDLAERKLRLIVYLDHVALMRRHESSVRNTSSMVVMPSPSHPPSFPATQSYGENSNKRERSNTQTSPGPRKSSEPQSPPRKRSANAETIRSPIRSLAAERAKKTGQPPLRDILTLPTRPIIFQAAFTEAYCR
ncbi:hypothetical protein SISSUDRAFT_1038734, partial [Sistotremastrum suecicum HHB10207 ss-3]